MVMTSELVRHDIERIEALIAALGASYPADADDLNDLAWLKERRIHLLALLASRRQLRLRKIVRLDLWRDGCVAEASRTSKAA